MESLTNALDREDSLGVLLQRVCQQVLHALPDVDMAGATLTGTGQPQTVGCTDETVAQVDAEQYRAGAGPCLHAAVTGTLVRVTLEDAQQRWPQFAGTARAAGVASYLSAPLFIDTVYQGALNLYSEREHGFGQLDAAILELYTTAVEGYLRTWQRYQHTQQLAEQLRQALNSAPHGEEDNTVNTPSTNAR